MVSLLQHSYRDLEKAFATKEFFTVFFEELKKYLDRYYGKAEGQSLLKLIENKKIKIVNPEVFFDSSVTLGDPSMSLRRGRKEIREFFISFAKNYKTLANKGACQLEFPLFFFALYSLFNIGRVRQERLDEQLTEMFLIMGATKNEGCAGTIQIPDFFVTKFLCKKFKMNMAPQQYVHLLRLFMFIYRKIINNPLYKEFNFPEIELLHGIYKDDRIQVLFYLADFFGEPTSDITRIMESVKTFSKDSAELRAALGILRSQKGEYFDMNEDELVNEIIRISNQRPYNSYPRKLTDNNLFAGIWARSKTLLLSLNQKYIALDTCESLLTPVHSEIEVDCTGISEIDEITALIYSATKIGLIKERLLNKSDAKLLVTLKEVSFVSDEFMNSLKSAKESIKSTLNRDVLLSVKFCKDFAESKFEASEAKYLRVISDIHWDINRGRGYKFNFGEDFVINCGDTASRYDIAASWATANMRRGVIVPGNHLGYDYPYEDCPPSDIKNTKDFQITRLTRELKSNPNLTVVGLKTEPIKVADKVCLIGSTLYSDLRVFGDEHVEEAKFMASHSINDFKRCYIITNLKDRIARQFTIEDHIKKFNRELAHIDKKLKKLRKDDKKIIVVTHFAPLPFSIADEYKNDLLSAYFVNDLTELLNKYPCVKLWCHGHTHAKFDYIYRRRKPVKNGGWCETRVICNPFGYYNENNADLPNYGTRVSIADMQSNKLWSSLLEAEIESGKIVIYENRKDIWRENYNKRYGIVDQS